MQDPILNHSVNSTIKGIFSPYAWAGTPWSNFALHREDFDLVSVNYRMEGADKFCYG